MKRFQLNLFSGSLLFTALFIPLLLLSQSPTLKLALLGGFSFLFLSFIWFKSHDFQGLDSRSFIQLVVIFTLTVLPFSIFYNHHFIRLLWDTYIGSNGTHPYTVLPIDPLIGKGQSTVLFNLLELKDKFSTTSPALLIALRPLHFLVKSGDLFLPLIFSKILLSSFLWFTVWKIKDYIGIPFWLYNPFIWIIGLSQADFELIGLISFAWGYFYFREKEFQNAYLIWGLSSTFGFPYLILVAFFLILNKHYNYLGYLILTAAIWLFMAWDSSGFYNYYFVSQWLDSLPYLILSKWKIIDIGMISLISYVCLFSSSFLLLFWGKSLFDSFTKQILLLCSFLLFLPLSTSLIWALLAFGLIMQHKNQTYFKFIWGFSSLLIVLFHIIPK